jgi:predicted CoA-substrate-specific enzyme activase
MSKGKVAGIDVGAGTVKVAVLDAGRLAGFHVLPVGFHAATSIKEVTAQALKIAEISSNELDYVVSTGYGRGIVPFANEMVSEIMCHAKGVYSLFPKCRTVIDIGCQDCKAIKLGEQGSVTNFVMNDKCAAGTGRFIEVLAHTLSVDIGENTGPDSRSNKRSG